jgi:hypothetical protein
MFHARVKSSKLVCYTKLESLEIIVLIVLIFFFFIDEEVIPAGDHVLHFSSPLPAKLPTNFDDDHGSIKYTVKATLAGPWRSDHNATIQFNVVSPMDLNLNVKARASAKMN